MLYLILFEVSDFPTILFAYGVSTLVSLLCFYYLKIFLMRGLSSEVEENVEVHESIEDSGRRQPLLLFAVILLLLATPLVILFLIPELWLIILNGIILGASVSELILYFVKKR